MPLKTYLTFYFFLILFLFCFFLNGQTTTVSTFLNKGISHSEAFKEAIFTNDTIIFNKMIEDWEIDPIRLNGISNKVIIFERNLLVKAKQNSFEKLGDCFFEFVNCDNIQIIGNNAIFKMNKKEYTTGEWRHGISLRSCKDISISDLIIKDSGGDGIYIAGTKKGTFSENILIKNVISDNNKRQGMSIISAKNVLIEDCAFINTVGILPGAGIDIEPNNKYDCIDNIVFVNCVFKNNDHSGITISLGKLEKESGAVNIKFLKCLLENNHSVENKYIASEIVFGAHKTNPVKGEVVFEDCLIRNSLWGVFYSRKVKNAYKVTFNNCMAKDICKDNSYPAIYLEVPDYYSGSYSLGGYVFNNLLLEYKTDVPYFQVRGSRLNTLKEVANINGNLIISGKTLKERKYINYAPINNVNVNLKLILKSKI